MDKVTRDAMSQFETEETLNGEVVQPKTETKDADGASAKGTKSVSADGRGSGAAGKKADAAKGADDGESDDGESDKSTPSVSTSESAAEGDDGVDSDDEGGGDKEAEGEEAPKQEAKPQKQRKSTPPEKRIAHYKWVAAEEQRKREAAESELATLRKGSAAPQKDVLTTQKPSATDADKDEPKPENFKYGELDPAYTKAVIAHGVKKGLAEEKAAQESKRQKDAAEQQAKEVQTKTAKLVEAGKDKFEDFDEIVSERFARNQIAIPDPVFEMALDSEVGAEILYHLASNPKEARELFGKSERAQAAYFGRLEAKLSSPPSTGASPETEDDEQDESAEEQNEAQKPAPVKTSKAPPPPQNRARGAGGKTQVSPDTTDFGAFERMATRAMQQ